MHVNTKRLVLIHIQLTSTHIVSQLKAVVKISLWIFEKFDHPPCSHHPTTPLCSQWRKLTLYWMHVCQITRGSFLLLVRFCARVHTKHISAANVSGMHKLHVFRTYTKALKVGHNRSSSGNWNSSFSINVSLNYFVISQNFSLYLWIESTLLKILSPSTHDRKVARFCASTQELFLRRILVNFLTF